GRSTRMGRNKLLCEIDGKTLIRRSAETLIKAGLSPILAVTGHEAGEIRAALAGLPLDFVHNPDYEQGLSTSLICGINALTDVAAALIALGDMPQVSAAAVKRLIAAFNPAQNHLICVPTHHGQQGNPVLWSRNFFPEMRGFTGDR